MNDLAKQSQDIIARAWAVAGRVNDVYQKDPGLAERVKHDTQDEALAFLRANMPAGWQSSGARELAALDRPVTLAINEAQRFLQANFQQLIAVVPGAVGELGAVIDRLVEWKQYTGPASSIAQAYGDPSVGALVKEEFQTKLPLFLIAGLALLLVFYGRGLVQK